MPRFAAGIHLIRPINCVLAMIGVLVGAHLAGGESQLGRALIAGLCAFFVCGAGNALNDVVDIETDRVSHPDRALVSGVFSRNAVIGVAIVLNIVGLLLAFAVGLPLTLIVVGCVVLLAVYNFWLKRVPLLGNLTVGVLGATTLITGGVAMDPGSIVRLPGPSAGALLAFLIHVAREIVKDVQDIGGDRLAGIRTLPLTVGVRPALGMAIAVFFVLAALLAHATYYQWYSVRFLAIVSVLVLFPNAVLLGLSMVKPTKKRIAVLASSLKVGMAVGMVALILG